MDVPQTPASVPADRAGWSVERFVEATGVSRSMLYAMRPELQPAFVKVGKRRVITESPARWLERLRLTQARRQHEAAS